MAKITGDIDVAELVEQLVAEGILESDLGFRLTEQFGRRAVEIEVTVDPDDLVEEASTKILTEAARDRDDYIPDSMDVEIALVADAVKAIVDRDHAMAIVLFERVFGEGAMHLIERALRA